MKSKVTEEDFKAMELHEQLKINEHCSVMRVPGGWNYFYEVYGNISVVFVEFPHENKVVVVDSREQYLDAIKSKEGERIVVQHLGETFPGLDSDK